MNPNQDPIRTTWRPETPAGPPKAVLLVEDDRATLNLYRLGLKGLAGFQVLLAEHGGIAREILRDQPVDVLVTDLRMPVMDGFQLIAWTSAHYPALPILVMTGVAETEHMNLPITLGALRILSKPPRLSVLMDEIRAAAARPPEGMVRGIGLTSLMQLLNWEKKSCTLTVKSEHAMGLVYCRDGEIIHAAYRDREGLEAVYEILNWSQTEIEFVDTCRVEPTIDLPLAEILMNTALVRDLGAQRDASAEDSTTSKGPEDPWELLGKF